MTHGQTWTAVLAEKRLAHPGAGSLTLLALRGGRPIGPAALPTAIGLSGPLAALRRLAVGLSAASVDLAPWPERVAEPGSTCAVSLDGRSA